MTLLSSKHWLYVSSTEGTGIALFEVLISDYAFIKAQTNCGYPTDNTTVTGVVGIFLCYHRRYHNSIVPPPKPIDSKSGKK